MITKAVLHSRTLAGLVNSTLIFRCFPPYSQEATSSLGASGSLETTSSLETISYLENTKSLEVPSSLETTWCLPREYPVAEAGPGVSYPGYKQYCRYGHGTVPL